MNSDFGKLMRSITANVNNYIGINIEDYGIKRGQMDYFLMIFQTPGINQLEMSKQKRVGKTAVTKAVKILEEDGFVVREVDEKDKRNFKCYISKKGENIVKELMDVKNSVEKKLFKDFDSEELKLLFKLMERINRNSDQLINEKDS